MIFVVSLICAFVSLIGFLVTGNWLAAAWVIIAALWMGSSYNQERIIKLLQDEQ